MKQYNCRKKTGRVLLIGNFLSGSIANRNVCEDLSDRLKEKGWDVFTASDKSDRLAKLADMVKTTWRKRFDYDVAQVDVFSGPAFFWAETVCWVLRRAEKPYVLTLHGGNLPVFSQHWPNRVTRLLRSARAVTAPSHFLKDRMRYYRDDIVMIPNALDTDLYRFRLRNRPEARLVWIRAFHDIYNPALAPVVLSKLIDEFPSMHLLMIGPDKKDGSLKRTVEIAAKLNVSDSITIQEGIPKADIPSWLDRGDIFLNTSRVDNAPVTVVEAMASGLCIVSTNVGGMPHLLHNGTDALLAVPGDPESVAVAVRRILSEPGLAGRLSYNARQKTTMFDWSAVLPMWEKMLILATNGKSEGEFHSEDVR